MMSIFQDVPWKLYGSRMMSSWGDRMWWFAVALFMIELSPESLKWQAIYGLTQSLCLVFFGPVIGRWVDRTPRWKAARISLICQNSAVVVCATCVALTFYYLHQLKILGDGWGLTGACSVIVVLGSLAQLASEASSIVVNKDWVVIISDGDKDRLARMNSTCRSIDLSMNIIAPIVVGQVMYFLSHTTAAISIASWNIFSFAIEILLLWRIYKGCPKLALKETDQKEEQPLHDGENQTNTLSSSNPKKDTKSSGSLTNWLKNMIKTWQIYFQHRVRNAGIGLSCLYLTVLGFDAITTGFAYSQGVSESILGAIGAFGAVVGLLGSVTFPLFVRRLGVERTGLYGFGLEVMCLTLCVASVWAPGSPFNASALINGTVFIDDPFRHKNAAFNATDYVENTVGNPDSYVSVILLMSGIIAARFGLWVADLSVSQVLQGVEYDIRGTVNGVQSSMNMIFDTAKFILVIALPHPFTFGYLICVSFASIVSGWMFYASYSYQERGHLLPFHAITNVLTAEEIHQINIKGVERKNSLTS